MKASPQLNRWRPKVGITPKITDAELITGIAVRVLQRVLALTAAIWHNWHTGQPIMRSLVAYDH